MHDRVRTVVPPVAGQEFRLVAGQLEAPGRHQPEIGEVQPVPVGEDVAEVGVEVQQPVRVHEPGGGGQPPRHHGDGRHHLARVQPRAEPFVQVQRHVFEEQHHARGRFRQRLQPFPHGRRTVPVRHRGVDVGVLLGRRWRTGQYPPVVHQRERAGTPGQRPACRHRVRGQFPPRPEARTAHPVVAVRRQPEQVRRRHHVLGPAFQVGQRDPLDEHGYALDVQPRGIATDTGAHRCCPRHEGGQPPVGQRRQRGRYGAVATKPGPAGKRHQVIVPSSANALPSGTTTGRRGCAGAGSPAASRYTAAVRSAIVRLVRQPAPVPAGLGGVDGRDQRYAQVLLERDRGMRDQPVVGVHDVVVLRGARVQGGAGERVV